jgi:hypothetical protein
VGKPETVKYNRISIEVWFCKSARVMIKILKSLTITATRIHKPNNLHDFYQRPASLSRLFPPFAGGEISGWTASKRGHTTNTTISWGFSPPLG